MKNKGITLIALIITVIVLLILAGTAISIAINGGDIFSKANNAKSEWNRAVNDEETQINNMYKILKDYTERRWTVGWVYKNSEWSNPYFNDESLENIFDFEYLDTSHSIFSEDELVGDFVIKLYADGELNISGTGELPIEEAALGQAPWKGSYHADFYDMSSDYFYNYLINNVSKVVLAEGITSIPRFAFSNVNYSDFELPSTITNIDETAFEFSDWIYMLDETIPGFYDEIRQTRYVNYPLNGYTFELIVSYD